MATQIDARSLLTEGVFLAAVSAFVYFIAFVYEYGYCSYFGVPAALISPNASTLLVATFALGVTLLPALNYLAFTTPLFLAARDPKHRPYSRVYAILAILLASGILLGAIYGLSLRGITIYVVTSVALMAFLFLPALISNRKLSIAERLERNNEIQKEDPLVVTNLFDGWLSRRHLGIALLALVALIIAHLVGDAEAQEKRRFLALKADSNLVLLRNYGNLFILARINDEGDRLTDDVRLLWLSEIKELDLVFRNVGPIRKSLSSNSISTKAAKASASSSSVASDSSGASPSLKAPGKEVDKFSPK